MTDQQLFQAYKQVEGIAVAALQSTDFDELVVVKSSGAQSEPRKQPPRHALMTDNLDVTSEQPPHGAVCWRNSGAGNSPGTPMIYMRYWHGYRHGKQTVLNDSRYDKLVWEKPKAARDTVAEPLEDVVSGWFFMDRRLGLSGRTVMESGEAEFLALGVVWRNDCSVLIGEATAFRPGLCRLIVQYIM